MRRILLVSLLFLLAGCSQGIYMQGKHLVDEGQYDSAIDLYYNEIKANPKSSDAWRELGVAFYKKGDLIKAEDALKQANNIKPDARANLFIGLIYEKQKDFGKAIDAYRAALAMKPKSNTKKMLTEHLDGLIHKKINQEITLALENESGIDINTIPDNTIGVVNFDNSHLPPELVPISNGLAELTSIDLSKVQSLRVVDRLKIDMILKELELSASQYADPTVGPRLGKLLGSRNIVSGVVLGMGDDEIRLDGAVTSTIDSSSKPTAPVQDDLAKFFAVEKEFVFNIIANLGITLTAAERDSIQKIPTESYLAFMAYCRGLELRSQGLYHDAGGEFNRAVTEDNGFDAARQEGESMGRLSAGAGEAQTFEQFETSLTTASDNTQYSSELEGFQSSTLSSSGFIGDSGQSEQFGRTPDKPPLPTPVVNAGTVIIRGNLDGDQQ